MSRRYGYAPKRNGRWWLVEGWHVFAVSADKALRCARFLNLPVGESPTIVAYRDIEVPS